MLLPWRSGVISLVRPLESGSAGSVGSIDTEWASRAQVAVGVRRERGAEEVVLFVCPCEVVFPRGWPSHIPRRSWMRSWPCRRPVAGRRTPRAPGCGGPDLREPIGGPGVTTDRRGPAPQPAPALRKMVTNADSPQRIREPEDGVLLPPSVAAFPQYLPQRNPAVCQPVMSARGRAQYLARGQPPWTSGRPPWSAWPVRSTPATRPERTSSPAMPDRPHHSPRRPHTRPSPGSPRHIEADIEAAPASWGCGRAALAAAGRAPAPPHDRWARTGRRRRPWAPR